MKIYSCIPIMFFFTSCYSQQHEANCYANQLDSLKRTVIYTDVKNKALDTLHSWISSGIMASGIPPLRNGFEWKIDDAIFFNKNRTRVILLIIEKDTVFNSKSDYIQFYFGIRTKQDWRFYFKSLLAMYIPRKINAENIPHSFEELSVIGTEQVLKE